MAGSRRTRAQKERAHAHRDGVPNYSFVAQDTEHKIAQPVQAPTLTSTQRQHSLADLFPYNPQLIYKDLRRTVVITGLILVTLVLLRFRLG